MPPPSRGPRWPPRRPPRGRRFARAHPNALRNMTTGLPPDARNAGGRERALHEVGLRLVRRPGDPHACIRLHRPDRSGRSRERHVGVVGRLAQCSDQCRSGLGGLFARTPQPGAGASAAEAELETGRDQPLARALERPRRTAGELIGPGERLRRPVALALPPLPRVRAPEVEPVGADALELAGPRGSPRTAPPGATRRRRDWRRGCAGAAASAAPARRPLHGRPNDQAPTRFARLPTARMMLHRPEAAGSQRGDVGEVAHGSARPLDRARARRPLEEPATPGCTAAPGRSERPQRP